MSQPFDLSQFPDIPPEVMTAFAAVQFELSVERAARQRVFQDTQVDARLPSLLAQRGNRSDFQTTVLGDNDRLGLCQFGSDFFDDYRFLFTIETHG